MKALVGAFNQEKALVGAFSVILKTDCETDGAIHSSSPDPLGYSDIVTVAGYWLSFMNTFNTYKMEEGMGICCFIHCHESHTEIQIFTIKCNVCHVACAVLCPRVKILYI